MTLDSMDLRRFVLGLLAQQPMSGYDINRFLEGLDWLIGRPSFGSLYPVLHSLLEKGLVTVETFARAGLPARKVYTISEAGRQEFEEWWERSSGPDRELKTFVMRLALGGSSSRLRLLAQLRQRRARVAGRMAMMEEIAARENDARWGRRLAMDYGLALAAAEVAWLDRTIERLSPPQA